MADSHYMQMMEGFFSYYLLVTTGGHGVKVILQTMKDWLWMTASTSGLHIVRFRRRFGQWNTLFTELCAQNLLAALARRNSCYCFCGMKSLDANQLWHEVEDRAVTAIGPVVLSQNVGLASDYDGFIKINDERLGEDCHYFNASSSVIESISSCEHLQLVM